MPKAKIERVRPRCLFMGNYPKDDGASIVSDFDPSSSGRGHSPMADCPRSTRILLCGGDSQPWGCPLCPRSTRISLCGGDSQPWGCPLFGAQPLGGLIRAIRESRRDAGTCERVESGAGSLIRSFNDGGVRALFGSQPLAIVLARPGPCDEWHG